MFGNNKSMIRLAPSPRDHNPLSPRGGGKNAGGSSKRGASIDESGAEVSTNTLLPNKHKFSISNSSNKVLSPRLASTSHAVAVDNKNEGGGGGGFIGGVINDCQRQQPQRVASSGSAHHHASVGGVGSALTSSYSGAPTFAMAEEDGHGNNNNRNKVRTQKGHNNHNNNNSSSAPAPQPSSSSGGGGGGGATEKRTKRMLVVDPKSGQKYTLHDDDHSLTDKELHIYHKRQQQQKQRQNHRRQRSQAQGELELAAAAMPATPIPTTRPINHRRSQSIDTLNTYSTPLTFGYGDYDHDQHTLETASALTEVSYKVNNNRGVGSGCFFDCIIPSSCKSLEHLVLMGDLAMHAEEENENEINDNGGAEAACNINNFVKDSSSNNNKEEEEEERDDVESIEQARYKHLLLKIDTNNTTPSVDDANNDDNNNGEGGGRQQQQLPKPPLLSPLSNMFHNILSPSNISNALVRPTSFFGGIGATTTHNKANVSRGENVREIKFRRVCLLVFPNEVQTALGNSGRTKNNNASVVGLLGMTFIQNSHDFQAHVNYVQRGSKADRLGIRKGDIVSFAVALSNMTFEDQNSFLAEKIIKRLESVGMRTSYRELYDIFLSKTTNCRPIGLVFRRWKDRNDSGVVMNNNPSSSSSPPLGSPTDPHYCITNEFEWSTGFLQDLSIKCREYEFELKVPHTLDTNDNDGHGHHHNKMTVTDNNNNSKLSTFLPRPNVDMTPSSNNGLITEYLSGIMGNLNQCIYGAPSHHVEAPIKKQLSNGRNDDILSNRTLCSLVEQSMGLLFLRRVISSPSNDDRKKKTTISSSGFAVVRKAEGEWSAPCFLSILGTKDKFTDLGSTVNDTSTLTPVQSDDIKLIVIRKKELVDNLIEGNTVKFSLRKEERANVLVRDAAAIGVEDGRFLLTPDFFLAVKVNDTQNQGAYYKLSTDHIEASDILTGLVSPPEQSVDFYGALQSLELPYSMHSHPVIPDVLLQYSDSDWVEFLPFHSEASASSCGMRTKLQMISQRNSADDMREIDIFARKFKYYLMDGVPVHRILSASSPSSTEEKVLRLTIKDPESLFSSSLELTRKRRPGVSNVGIPGNFSTTFENITKLSRTPPPQLQSTLDDEEKKRFFSVETDLTPAPILMLSKSKKDAMILLCGLVLLLEREKMRS